MKYLMTKEGLEELQKELQDRKTSERETIANEIEKAREQGDLSENAAYKAALDKKEMNELQIVKLEETIMNAQVVAENVNKNKIGMGTRARVSNETLDKKYTFVIVGESEADPGKGRISLSSPLGIAMIGKKTGDIFKFKTPAGEHIYKVLEII